MLSPKHNLNKPSVVIFHEVVRADLPCSGYSNGQPHLLQVALV